MELFVTPLSRGLNSLSGLLLLRLYLVSLIHTFDHYFRGYLVHYLYFLSRYTFTYVVILPI